MNRVDCACTEILGYLVRKGFTYQVTDSEVDEAIWKLHGMDNRTVRNWKRVLEKLGYLERVSGQVWSLNLVKVPELLSEATRKKQVKLM